MEPDWDDGMNGVNLKAAGQFFSIIVNNDASVLLVALKIGHCHGHSSLNNTKTNQGEESVVCMWSL